MGEHLYSPVRPPSAIRYPILRRSTALKTIFSLVINFNSSRSLAMALLGIQLEKPTIGNAQRSKAKRTRFVIRERAERLKLGRGSSRFPCMKVTLGNVKKTGRETFCLPPRLRKTVHYCASTGRATAQPWSSG